MFSLLAMALPAILQAVPELIATFGHGGEISTRNEKAARVIVDTASKALGAFNEQDLIQKLQNDPSAADTVRQAVKASPDVTAALFEVGGGAAAARKAWADPGQIPVLKNPAFWIALAMLPLVYIVVVGAVWNVGGGWSEQLRTVVVVAVMSGIVGGITGFFFGSSYGSQRKDEAKPAAA